MANRSKRERKLISLMINDFEGASLSEARMSELTSEERGSPMKSLAGRWHHASGCLMEPTTRSWTRLWISYPSRS